MSVFNNNPNNILAIDHGNYAVKTPDETFSCNLTSEINAPALTDEYISYGNLKWTLSSDVPYYLKNKTNSENLFVQTLFAIKKEMDKGRIDVTKPINLALGLPPIHMKTMKKSYLKYFKDRASSRLIYGGEKGVDIQLGEIKIYPQGYSAINFALMNSEYQLESTNIPTFLIIDIGGGTVDIVYIRDNKPATEKSKSYDLGINFMISEIINNISSNLGIELSSKGIEDILLGRGSIYTMPANRESEISKQILNIIAKGKYQHVQNIFAKIKMAIPEATSIPWIFEGGGSELLKSEILSDKIAPFRSPMCEFLTQQNLNACGYRMLMDMYLSNTKNQ